MSSVWEIWKQVIYLKFYFVFIWTIEVSIFVRTNKMEMQRHSRAYSKNLRQYSILARKDTFYEKGQFSWKTSPKNFSQKGAALDSRMQYRSRICAALSLFSRQNAISLMKGHYTAIPTHCHLQLCQIFIKVLLELLIKTLPNETISDLIWIVRKSNLSRNINYVLNYEISYNIPVAIYLFKVRIVNVLVSLLLTLK